MSIPANKKAALVATAAAVGLTTLGLFYQRRRRHSLQNTLPRNNLSFTSAALAIGTFPPPKINQVEPTIHVAIYFDTHLPSEQEVVDHVISKLLRYDRLAMIPSVPYERGALREPHPSPLDPYRLVRRIHVNGQDELYRTIQDCFNESLANNPHRGDLPWWELVLLENQAQDDGPHVCLWRIHHALGDGISLAAVMVKEVLKFTDGSSISDLGAFLPPSMMSNKKVGQDNHQQHNNWFQRICKILDSARQIGGLRCSKFDDPTVFSQGCKPDMVHSRNREVVILPTIPLDFIKALKNSANVTVNDIICTCLSQAIHDYCIAENCPVLGDDNNNNNNNNNNTNKRSDTIHIQCRALLPAALPRSIEQATAHNLLRNKWFLLSCDMGLGYQDIIDRLNFVHDHFQALKASPLAWVGLYIQNHILKYAPMWLNQQVVYDTVARHSMMVSNVPGPSQPVLFANKEVTGVQVMFSNLISHVMFISYGGKVFGNLTIDPATTPDGQSLAKWYRNAMVTLAQRLNVTIPAELLE